MAKVRIHKGMYSALCHSPDLKLRLTEEGYQVFAWEDAPGAVYSEHSHPHDEFIVVASGSICFIVGGQEHDLQPGDAMELPAGTVHAAVNRAAAPVSYYICTR